ncbi:Uncharacterised protein [Corynebacterium kutscheri]|nr:Uncharacterised protein [Corynebacterium kutscheri]
MSTTFISTTRSTVSRNELARHTAAYRTPVKKLAQLVCGMASLFLLQQEISIRFAR